MSSPTAPEQLTGGTQLTASPVAIRDEVRFADPLWRAEFCGFFAADGCIGVASNKNDGTGERLFVACATIVLRDDDRAVLEAISEVIGGSVWGERSAGRRPTAVWRTRTPATIGRICDVLEEATLPFAKQKYVPMVREFLSFVGALGPEAHEQRARIHEALRVAHTCGGDASPIGVELPVIELCVCTHRRARHYHPKRVNPYGCRVCNCTRFQSAEADETGYPTIKDPAGG